jgi:hypothetical protein
MDMFATSSALSPFFVVVMLVLLVVFLGLAIFEVVAMWVLYTKAGKPGWAALIPFYNTWVMAEIAGKPGWWGLYPLLFCIPVVGTIGGIIISVILAIGLARNFGQSDTFGVVGLWLFNAVGYPVLAFGPAVYNPMLDTLPPAQPVPPATA